MDMSTLAVELLWSGPAFSTEWGLPSRADRFRTLAFPALGCGNMASHHVAIVYLESQWLIVMDDFKPIMVYFGV